MKSEWRLFGLLSAFLFLAAVVYGFWTKYSLHGVDWIGTTALVLCGLLTTMCTLFFFVVSRRIDPRPEDDPDAEISGAAAPGRRPGWGPTATRRSGRRPQNACRSTPGSPCRARPRTAAARTR